MNLREYLKKQKKTISWLSTTAKVPYSTVYEIANGKTDIQKVQFGTVLRLCNALKITANELFELCPNPSKWTVFLDGDDYYMTYSYGKEKITKRVCKNNPTNSKYINAIAESFYEEMMCENGAE